MPSVTDSKAALAYLPLPAFICDRQGYVIDCNDALALLVGGGWLGKLVDRLFPTGTRSLPPFDEVLKQLEAGHRVLPQPVTFFGMPGLCMLADVRMVRDEQGALNSVLYMLTDISHIRPVPAPDFEHDSDERYHKMVGEVEDYAILMLDRDGIILNWNKGAEKIKGYAEEEAVGQHFGIFYLPEDRAAHLPEQLIEEALRHGKAIHEGWRVRKDQSVFWGSIVITALHDGDQNVIGFTKVTRDLTERRNAEDKLRQYAGELEYQNSELMQFSYIASHDLQEPLRKIMTFGEMLQRNEQAGLSDEARDIIRRMQLASSRMKSLIEDLLSYSRISKEADSSRDELLNISGIVRDAMAELEDQLHAKQGTITVGRLYPACGNEWQLRQMFLNLLGNSIKYSRSQVAPAIDVSASLVSGGESGMDLPTELHQQRFQRLVIRDNGIGFDPQYADKIFQVFQRLHGRHEYEGSGVGLSIVQKIVKRHHGYIQAAGYPGEGAVFTILLPYPTP